MKIFLPAIALTGGKTVFSKIFPAEVSIAMNIIIFIIIISFYKCFFFLIQLL
jgi:hypothetical protein